MTKSDGGRLPTIVITGFMGTGKSTVGKALSGMLGLAFIDTDAEIERRQDRTIAEIFAADGESAFRRMEREFCANIEHRQGVVVATGGGTLVSDDNQSLFTEYAKFVLLETSPEKLTQRLSRDNNRPLLQDGDTALAGGALRDRIESILAKRARWYQQIENRIDTTATTAGEAAARIAASITPRSESFVISPTGAADLDVPQGRFGLSQIETGRGVLSTIGTHLRSLRLTTHAFLLMPEGIRTLFYDQIAVSLEDAGIPHIVIPVEDGDPKKNVEQSQRIIDDLITSGARRDAVIIPVGGGVTGDIGGFAASLFMRGVPLVHVPTTLLAQVDSSIGGKVGVNHPLAKNLIGAFYQPHLVLNDPSTLRTLPLEEVSNGMAEVVKAALIDSPAFFEFLEDEKRNDAETHLRDIGFLERCVIEAAKIKCDIVNEDPYERNQRRALNLGHTVGHALEASASYEGLKHGQAVALGLIAAYQIAVDRGTAGQDELDRVVSLLSWCKLPTTLDSFDREAVARGVNLDKKIRKGKLHFILPTGIGTTRVVDDVSVDEILATMAKRWL